MTILILGGTGRTGQLAVAALRGVGHDLRALHRRAVPDVDTRIAGLDDIAAMKDALSDVTAVVSTLASGNRDPVCSTATRTLIAAAGDRPLRYVVVSGAGVDVPGDAKALPDRMIGGLMRLVVGGMLKDRQAEHALLERSALAWTLLRPPRLTDGPATGQVAWRFETPASTQISRADLAAALVEALSRDDLVRRAPFVSAVRR